MDHRPHRSLFRDRARQLSPKLRPKYVALGTRRVVLAPADENGGVGGHVASRMSASFHRMPPKFAHSRGGRCFSAADRFPANLPEPIPHISVEIRDVAEAARLVTCIGSPIARPTKPRRGPGGIRCQAAPNPLRRRPSLGNRFVARRHAAFPPRNRCPLYRTSSSSAGQGSGRRCRYGRSRWPSRCRQSMCPYWRATLLSQWIFKRPSPSFTTSSATTS